MSTAFESVIAALGIPAGAQVDQRVPKKTLLEHGAPTASDKRQIQDGIEEILWVAALKPTNIGVPAFKDEEREYLEVAVLTVLLRPTANPTRLIELIHRAIPYPLVLLTGGPSTSDITLSLAHKRWSQGEAGKVVLDPVRTVVLNPLTPTAEEAAFLASLSVSQLPAENLFALYDGMLARLAALEASRITGEYAIPLSPAHATDLRDGLGCHARLLRELEQIRAKAASEKQINRRVQLNLAGKALEEEIKRLEAELAAIMKNQAG